MAKKNNMSTSTGSKKMTGSSTMTGGPMDTEFGSELSQSGMGAGQASGTNSSQSASKKPMSQQSGSTMTDNNA